MLGSPHSSVGKESACNEGDPSLIPGSGRSAGEYVMFHCKNKLWDILGGPLVGNPRCNAGDMGLIPGLGRSHGPWGN